MDGVKFRLANPLLALGLLGGLPDIVHAASDSQPHYHRGKLTPYQIGPPSLLLSGRDEEKLRAGRRPDAPADNGSRHPSALFGGSRVSAALRHPVWRLCLLPFHVLTPMQLPLAQAHHGSGRV